MLVASCLACGQWLLVTYLPTCLPTPRDSASHSILTSSFFPFYARERPTHSTAFDSASAKQYRNCKRYDVIPVLISFNSCLYLMSLKLPSFLFTHLSLIVFGIKMGPRTRKTSETKTEKNTKSTAAVAKKTRG